MRPIAFFCRQNGTLKIIDRKKHIFKLSQGEYIAPEKVENVYSKSQYVAQVFVYGEGLKSCVIGVIVPDVENVKYYAAEHNIPGTLSVLCNHPEIKQLIMSDITDLGKKAGLKSFEQVNSRRFCVDFFHYLNLATLTDHFLFCVYWQPGQRHLLAPGCLLRPERPVDADAEVEAESFEDLFQAPAGGHVQQTGLSRAPMQSFFNPINLILSLQRKMMHQRNEKRTRSYRRNTQARTPPSAYNLTPNSGHHHFPPRFR